MVRSLGEAAFPFHRNPSKSKTKEASRLHRERKERTRTRVAGKFTAIQASRRRLGQRSKQVALSDLPASSVEPMVEENSRTAASISEGSADTVRWLSESRGAAVERALSSSLVRENFEGSNSVLVTEDFVCTLDP
ncbi:hypothetical protein MTO96_003434 [Rhipicephalus appendiculatus]